MPIFSIKNETTANNQTLTKQPSSLNRAGKNALAQTF